MILHHKGLNINEELIKFKKGFKYSENISFIPMYYNNEELLLQSPNMYIPFDVIEYEGKKNKRYLDLTFQNSCDKVTSVFLENLDFIFNKVKKKYKNYNVNGFIRERGDYKWMRFKIEESTLFFDQNKKKIEDIPNKKFGVFILSLNGIWIIDGKIWFNWKILQSKLYIPTKLKEYYLFDEEDHHKKIIPTPPPPPPPPPPPSFIKENSSIKDQISKNKKNKKKDIKESDSFTPSINELMFALRSLNKIG